MVSFLMQMCHQKYPEPQAVVVLSLTDLPLDPSFRIAFTGYVTLDKLFHLSEPRFVKSVI